MGEPSSDRYAAKKIIYSRHNKQSDPKNGDAVELRPDSEKSVEAGNNNDDKTDSRKRKVNDGNTDFTVPKSKVPKCDAGKRDVHQYKDDIASGGKQSSDSYNTYYHHTDEVSAQKILESGYIKQSDPKHGDAVYGAGTYLTKDVGPGSEPSQVAKNNYDGMKADWESKINDGKTDVVFEVTVPKSQVKDCRARDRDVHLYKGDLRLKDAKTVRVHVRGKDGTKANDEK